jgi:hypothetical protein
MSTYLMNTYNRCRFNYETIRKNARSTRLTKTRQGKREKKRIMEKFISEGVWSR